MVHDLPKNDLPFMKMHGLGNDFVVLDERSISIAITEKLCRVVSDRHKGIGFDQLVVIRDDPEAHAQLIFYNADGSTAGACGNATRCVARHEMMRSGFKALTLRTERGLLACEDAGDGLTRVNMGAPLLNWQDVPLSEEVDTLHLPLPGDPVATGMGNPHCSFFVEDAEDVSLEVLGAEFEHSPLFPERTNVQFASLVADNHLRMRVWERGVGVTLASGSSSCAVAVAAHRRGLTGRSVRLSLDGGEIEVDWREDGVWMTGPTMHVCDGVFTEAFLNAL